MANDTISRQSAIDALNGSFKVTGRENAETIRDYINGVDKKLRDLPSAERRGRWEYPYGNKRVKVCSECGHHFTNNLPWQAFYCPICGARMEASE